MTKARALRLVPQGVCRECGQRLPATQHRRVCAACGKPILRGHKYVFVGSEVRHRTCEDPQSYTSPAPEASA